MQYNSRCLTMGSWLIRYNPVYLVLRLLYHHYVIKYNFMYLYNIQHFYIIQPMLLLLCSAQLQKDWDFPSRWINSGNVPLG